ncbi:hypothetical protein HGRIS_006890 [Hohenbuehelia grisea]|uniref:alpha-1,6-mannosyl-glycoprotein 6-beta-N-acetylglucosaminyltransferase n=1 Tax=Hohenbuehelia grisea TaxID=104357 RepID=A0ABR3JBI5_9AGAR
MHDLFACAMHNSCRENQTSVVLLSSPHFAGSIEGKVSGEDIWAASALRGLQEMGYTTLFAPRNEEMAGTYRRYPALIKAVILEGSDSEQCFNNPRCIKTATHPLGVPAWKMFSFHFWTGSSHPLGNAWTLSPENFPVLSPGNSKDNFYLGYSIERQCMKIPITPSQQRPMQGYVFAKQISYFYDRQFAWPGMLWEPPFELKLFAGMRNDTDYASEIPEGITNLGILPKRDFYEQLGKSRVLIGVGKPTLSPSPYDALCMGVPFINPILDWSKDHPDDRARWSAQHDTLKYEDPPYVYNVKKGDEDGLWEAVRQALDNPIDRYIIPAMRMDALKARLSVLVESDWRSKAEGVLYERKQSGRGKV